MDANMQLTINNFRQLFPDQIFSPDISQTFSKISKIPLTAIKFPDISRFSRQVGSLRSVTSQPGMTASDLRFGIVFERQLDYDHGYSADIIPQFHAAVARSSDAHGTPTHCLLEENFP